MRVFISYSSKDGIDYAKRLCEVLKEHGHDPFLIIHELCVSESPWDTIFREIKSRELVVFVVTESSQTSDGQKQEYDFATAKYKRKTAFSSESAWKKGIVDNRFPSLTIPQALVFSDKDFEEKCETVSTQLVRLKDRLEAVEEQEIDQKEISFPKLTIEGLDESEIAKCKAILCESYQSETIIPEAFIQTEAKVMKDMVNIGFNHRLPREWFLAYDETNTEYSNDFMFSEDGRNIAMGEREYLCHLIDENKEILVFERASDAPEDFLEQIKRAILVVSNKAKPKTIFPTINDWLKMYHFKKDASIKYDNLTPRQILRSSLTVEGTGLKIIEPLGKIPKHTILFCDNGVKWYTKHYPEYGALYLDLGNDRFYPKKFVQEIALTTVKCEIDSQGIAILKSNETKDNK